ncbi:MAG: SPOR domain-containing protein [Deltaproteobacteria bacterium]|nr:SPOR domain-containing protein [Deltaproteobacteria bacterium]MBW2171200.1 SPOR domain-containing protein [Deltaproteobacteria bacterium]MBW2259280.1 SPOR domain-containing protein [Deltaproteobacteria bacterium]
MSKKASESKKKGKGKSKGSHYTVKFTRRKLVFWSGIVFLAMVWMFTLGVLVGRGLSPVHFDVKRLKKDLIALKDKALKTDQTRSGIETDNLPEDPELGFYEVLPDRKKEIRRKIEDVKLQPLKLEAKLPKISEAGTTDKDKKPYVKLAEVHKDRVRLDKALTMETAMTNVPAGERPLTIQVASLQDAEEASEMVRLLKRKGYEAFSVALSLPEKGTYHRVRVGRFVDSSEASRVAARLKREGFEIMIFRE